MSTGRTLSIKCANSDATESFGERLGQKLKGGEVIELISDLGGGKTTLTRGIARGLGSSDHVSSPTFKISNIYKSGSLRLYHFDFYRLQDDAGLIEHELSEALEDPHGVVIVEWGEAVQRVLPTKRMTIQIHKTENDGRELICNYPLELEYLAS